MCDIGRVLQVICLEPIDLTEAPVEPAVTAQPVASEVVAQTEDDRELVRV
jgi:hypothetical protein